MGVVYRYYLNMASCNKVIVIFASLLSIVSSNNCFNEGKTWNTDGQLDFIPGVTSVQDCVKMCFENNACNGYTWFGDTVTRFKDVCTLFETLDDEYECLDCISGTKADLETCICDQKSGQCSIEDANFIDASHSESEFDRFLKCSAIKDCKYYTWFSLENEEVHQECLFFSTCETVESCSVGCFVGGVDCNVPPTPTTPAPTTPAPTTTSTTTPRTWNFCDDTIEYNVLDEMDRNVNNDVGPQYCDQTNNLKSSPDWKGPGWYRMKNPAGLQLSEEPIEPYHCGTSATGWLNGPHPTTLGETVGMQVCFNGGGGECQWITSIQVKNCGNFFLYYLEDAPYCPLRYCGK